MKRDIENAIEIAELVLQKSAAVLDLLKSDPTPVGLARAQAVEMRFNKIIEQKRLDHCRGTRRPRVVVIDECSEFGQKEWDAARDLINRKP